MFRENITNDTPLGSLAKSYMDKGDLVPDKVTIEMLENEVKTHPEADGFIFDGYPRTLAQAEALDAFMTERGVNINAVLALEVPENILVERLLNRGKDSGRADDQDKEKIRNRFQEYSSKTAPLVDYYTAQDKFHNIEGVGEISEITDRLTAVIDVL